jgi:hypothetical protein
MGADEGSVENAVGELAGKLIKESLDRYRGRIESTNAFKARMAKLLACLDGDRGLKAPMFILVDELDRCRPSYAIQMLEEVKHLFDVTGVVFIFATDGLQLEKAIGAVYGPNFDGKRYLLRFFDRQYRFADPDGLVFSRYLFSKLDTAKIDTPLGMDPAFFFSGIMVGFDLELRDALQCFDILRSVCTLWQEPVKIDLGYMLPLIAVFQQSRTDDFELLSREPKGQTVKTTQWSINETPEDYLGNRSGPAKIITLESLIESSRRQAFKPLRKSLEENTPSDRLGSWHYSRLLNEAAQVHKNTFRPGSSLLPLASGYSGLVRNLARLSAAQDS